MNTYLVRINANGFTADYIIAAMSPEQAAANAQAGIGGRVIKVVKA